MVVTEMPSREAETFFRITQLQALYSILYHGKSRPSMAVEWDEQPIVGVLPSEVSSLSHRHKAQWYAASVEVCNDGWMYVVILELAAEPAYYKKHPNHNTKKQWALDRRAPT